MNVTQITISYGGKIGLPGYSNIEIHAHVQVEITPEDGQDPALVAMHLSDLFAQVRASIQEQQQQALAELRAEQAEVASYIPLQ